jgi:hypothetical protein
MEHLRILILNTLFLVMFYQPNYSVMHVDNPQFNKDEGSESIINNH